MMNDPASPRTTRFGLGRGLGSLLPSTAAGFEEVDVDLIVPNPRQPRLAIDPAALADLAASVREHGILQPLLVSRRVSEGGGATYQLIAGERRLQAARAAGLARVPVVIREASPQGMLELALIENLQRADLNPLEEAQAYQHLVDDFGLTQEAIAARIGKSRTAVANTLRLRALPAEIQASLQAGEISEGHARALLGLADEQAMLQAWQAVRESGLSVRQTEELVRRLRAGSAPPDAAAGPARPVRRPDPALADIEERLQRSLGTKVNVERSRTGGRIVIRFYGDEDLESLIGRLLDGDAPHDR